MMKAEEVKKLAKRAHNQMIKHANGTVKHEHFKSYFLALSAVVNNETSDQIRFSNEEQNDLP